MDQQLAEQLATLCNLWSAQNQRPTSWAFPVDVTRYPPRQWYVAQGHNPAVHTGIDINLEIGGRGDIERHLGLSVYALADGVVHYVTDNWSGVGMVVVCHGVHFYARYAHITPVVQVGDAVKPGDKLGAFADWRTGDHLHLDMRNRAYTREWLSGDGWLNPVAVLKQNLTPTDVDALVRDDRS